MAHYRYVSECYRSETWQTRDPLNELVTSCKSESDTLKGNRQPEIKRFAGSLTSDLSAVRAAFTSPWNSGQVEGQINRLKFLTRQMYGRAKLDLLRARVLHPNRGLRRHTKCVRPDFASVYGWRGVATDPLPLIHGGRVMSRLAAAFQQTMWSWQQ